MNKSVSIIIPFYNNEKYLEHCIRSVCEQTYKDLDIILVDDGSTDGSLSVAEKYAGSDHRIQLLHEENSGVSQARNYGISKATGKYLTFVDGDDYIGVNYIETLVAIAEEHQSEMVFCGFTSLNEKNDRMQQIIPKHFKQDTDEIWSYRISGVCSRLYLREYWINNGLKFIDEPGARGEDIPIALYTSATAKNIQMAQTAEYYYVQHQGSAMHSGKKVLFDFPFRAFSLAYKRVRKHFLSMSRGSRDFFYIGAVKAMAQFEYLIYQKSPVDTKEHFHKYVLDLIGRDIDRMNQAWKKNEIGIDLPVQHKVAITLFLKKFTRLQDARSKNVVLKKKPLVSVCIPVYNNADYIADTIRSVINQSYPNIECILVDDHSFDNSLEIIRNTAEALRQSGEVSHVYDCTDREIKYLDTKNVSQKNDGAPEISFSDSQIPDVIPEGKSIFVYHNNENLGMSGNWNRCMELCRGKYIKLLCADDEMDPSLISREVQEMELHPEVLLVESDTAFCDNQDRTVGHYDRYGRGLTDGKRTARHSLFTRDYFGAPLANLVRASAYKKYGGFDSQFSYIVDYDFYMHIACHGMVYVIREPLNFFRLRDDSNTGEVLGGDQGKAYVEEHRKLVRKYAPILGLSEEQVHLSIKIRQLSSFLGGIYLKLKLGR